MKNLFKQLLAVVFIISYIVLIVMYVKVNTEYTMYKTFTEKGIKIRQEVPCTLPTIN